MEFSKANGGGMKFIGGGIVADHRVRKNNETGEVLGYGCNAVYMGGKQYIKLEAEMFDRLKDGDFITFEADVRQYKDNTYPGQFRIITINSKPVGAA
ncbi:MAG: hypothetical protein ACFCBV_07300 [Phycisphaerales bacterium]